MKKETYKTILKIYIIILCLLTFIFLGYTYNSLILFDSNEPENFIKNSLTSDKITKYYNGDKKSLINYYKDNDIKISLIETKDKIYSYGVYNNDELVTTVELKELKSYSRLLIFTIKNWQINNVSFNFENGLYSYNITIPYSYKLFVNNKEITDYNKTSDSIFERIINYDKDLISKEFTLNNYDSKPSIVIKDNNNKEVKYKIEKNNITIKNNYEKVDYLKLNKRSEIDVMLLAHNWSLFLTKDLSGSQNGFIQLKPYLIEDSYMYSLAARWAKGPEIYDVTEHQTPTFKNEEIVGCTVYSENTFSCEVKLDKTFKLTKSGEYRTDSMHEEMFFTYYNGGYKLTDMQSLGNN